MFNHYNRVRANILPFDDARHDWSELTPDDCEWPARSTSRETANLVVQHHRVSLLRNCILIRNAYRFLLYHITTVRTFHFLRRVMCW